MPRKAANQMFRIPLTKDGMKDMAVNGTAMPQEYRAMFPYRFKTTYLSSLVLSGVDKRIEDFQAFFGALDPLPYGVRYGYIDHAGTRVDFGDPIKTNIDLLAIAADIFYDDRRANQRDTMIIRFRPDTDMEMPSRAQGIYIIIQDDLSGMNYLEAIITGYQRR